MTTTDTNPNTVTEPDLDPVDQVPIELLDFDDVLLSAVVNVDKAAELNLDDKNKAKIGRHLDIAAAYVDIVRAHANLLNARADLPLIVGGTPGSGKSTPMWKATLNAATNPAHELYVLDPEADPHRYTNVIGGDEPDPRERVRTHLFDRLVYLVGPDGIERYDELALALWVADGNDPADAVDGADTPFSVWQETVCEAVEEARQARHEQMVAAQFG